MLQAAMTHYFVSLNVTSSKDTEFRLPQRYKQRTHSFVSLNVTSSDDTVFRLPQRNKQQRHNNSPYTSTWNDTTFPSSTQADTGAESCVDGDVYAKHRNASHVV